MKYFCLDGIIDYPMLHKFIDFYNTYSAQDCEIIMNTNGGSAWCGETIIRMINSMPTVNLLIHAAYSEGFRVAYHVTCPLIFSASARGMWHIGKQEFYVNLKGSVHYDEDKCATKNHKAEHKRDKALANKIMTANELLIYNKDEDVYFDLARLRQIFPLATILNS